MKPSERPISTAQARVYEEQAEAYDALISAEDTDGALLRTLLNLATFDGLRLADVGAGTGRISRLLGGRAAHVHLIDRAAPMLDVARARLESLGMRSYSLHVSDARHLPLDDASVDVAVAAWVFGHFRHWMPDGWQGEVDAALAEMTRVVGPARPIMVIESLGTGYEEPRPENPLDVYFDHLVRHHGFTKTWIRTDYQFPDVDTAARTCTAFFGQGLVDKIHANAWSRVPECTAVFVKRT